METRIKDCCRKLFKILGILPLTAEHIYSNVTMFVVNNRQYFMENSKLYDIKTRKKQKLISAIIKSVSQRCPLHAGIKI